MVLAGVGRALGGGWSVRLSAGALLGGRLEVRDATLDVRPGAAVSASVARRWMRPVGPRPFVDTTLAVAASFTRVEREGAGGGRSGATTPWTATDLRLGGTVGWVVADALAPYAAVRVFGGPVFWRDRDEARQGSDPLHLQVAAGLGVSLRSGLDLFVELAPLGEQALAAGVGYTFGGGAGAGPAAPPRPTRSEEPP